MLDLRSIILSLVIVVAVFPTQSIGKTAISDSTRIIWLLDRFEIPLPPDISITSDTSLFKQREYIFSTLLKDGYFNASIDSISISESENSTTIFSSRGCRFVLESLQTSVFRNGETVDELMEGFRPIFSRGNRFSIRGLESEINRLIQHFEQRGYMLVRISIKEMLPDAESCTVVTLLEVDTGDQLFVEDVLVSELSRNNPDFIRIASGVRPGMLITPTVMRNARLNLDNTELFETVEEPEIVSREGAYFLYFDLDETRTNAFDLLLGLVPKTGGGNDIIGSGELMVRNAMLDGSRLFLSFERLQPFVTKLDMSYDAYWLFGTPIGAGVHFNFLQQDSTYQVRNFGLNGSWALSATTSILATLRQESASSNAAPNIPVRILDASAWFAGIGARYVDTDNRLNPTSGFEANFLFETGIKRITDSRVTQFTDRRRLNQQEINANIRAFVSPFRRQVIAPSLNGYMMISKEFTENDLNRFGGATSLRGFREDQFQSSLMLWSDLEYRYLLDRSSFAFLFAALGYYERPRLITEPSSQPNITEWLYSYGFGFRYGTPIGIMKFTYAISGEDDFTNGKVHVGLRARF